MPVDLVVKWAGKEYGVHDLEETDTVETLKVKIMEKTGVRPERQKLLNIKVKGNFGLFLIIGRQTPLLLNNVVL